MPVPKIHLKNNVLSLELEGIRFEGMEIAKLKADLDVSDLLRIPLADAKIVKDFSPGAGIRIVKVGPQKIACIKLTRGFLGLGLKEAKDLLESPRPFLAADSFVDPNTSLAAVLRDFESVGAEVLVYGKDMERFERGPTVLDYLKERLLQAVDKQRQR